MKSPTFAQAVEAQLKAAIQRQQAPVEQPKLSGWHCRYCDVWGADPVQRARCWSCGRWDVELGRITPEPPGGAHRVRWDDNDD